MEITINKLHLSIRVKLHRCCGGVIISEHQPVGLNITCCANADTLVHADQRGEHIRVRRTIYKKSGHSFAHPALFLRRRNRRSVEPRRPPTHRSAWMDDFVNQTNTWKYTNRDKQMKLKVNH